MTPASSHGPTQPLNHPPKWCQVCHVRLSLCIGWNRCWRSYLWNPSWTWPSAKGLGRCWFTDSDGLKKCERWDLFFFMWAISKPKQYIRNGLCVSHVPCFVQGMGVVLEGGLVLSVLVFLQEWVGSLQIVGVWPRVFATLSKVCANNWPGSDDLIRL